jgi:hypothetical protein
MKNRHHRLATIGIALTIMLVVGSAAAVATDKPQNATGVQDDASVAVNLTAIHDPMSRSYDSDCLKCHAAILEESTRDPRVLAFHQAMIPYVPGYNARKGVQNAHCITCHRDAVDFDQESGTSLRRTVSIESCVYCHGRTGPGPVYFK